MSNPLVASTAPDATILAVGDTVRLKSGGHLATVIGVGEDVVECAWSVRDDFKSKKFPTAALVSDASPLSPLDAARRIAFAFHQAVSIEDEAKG